MTDKVQPKYTCAACGQSFDYGWSDEEARAESKQNYPTVPMDQMAIVCDDCFKTIRKWEEKQAR